MKGEKWHMRINALSSFAAGILISTTICGVAYFSDKSEVKTSVKTSERITTGKVQLSENEMKDQLVAAGYVVQTKDEYEQSIAAEPKTDTVEENSKNVTKVIVNVSNGMTSIDVGRTLEQAQLVPNAFNFSKDIESKGLQNKLRPGTYVVDSSMSYDQIIATIFH
jgi:mannitol-specific phosphotransferase system IIBC component